jgi:hypothetical protein
MLGPRTPLNVYLTTRALSPTAKPEDMKAVRDFVVTSSLGEEDLADPWRDWTQPKAAPQISALTSRLQLLHRFDLKEGWGAAPYAGRAGFPRWVSPRIDIFAAVPPLAIRQPLALWKPPVGVERGYAVVYTGHSAYSRDEGAMLVDRNSLGPAGIGGLKRPGRVGPGAGQSGRRPGRDRSGPGPVAQPHA